MINHMVLDVCKDPESFFQVLVPFFFFFPGACSKSCLYGMKPFDESLKKPVNLVNDKDVG